MIDAETARTLLDQVREMMSDENYIGVVELLSEAGVDQCDEVELHNAMAAAYFMLQDYEAAIPYFERVFKLNPKSSKPLINLGAVHNRMGKFSKAVEVLRKAVALDRRSAEAFYNLGLAHRQLKQYSMAVPAYREAIRLAPNMAEAYYNLGNTYMEMGSIQQAVSQFRRALQINPEFERAAKALANADDAILQRKNNANPFGRLVDTNKIEAAVAANNTDGFVELSEEDRAIDRELIARILRSVKGDLRRFSDCLKNELEPAVRNLSREMSQGTGDLRSVGIAHRAFEAAFRKSEPLASQLRATFKQLRTHEERAKKGDFSASKADG
jgi:tetratricopeptide (TPR) repeat protein